MYTAAGFPEDQVAGIDELVPLLYVPTAVKATGCPCGTTVGRVQGGLGFEARHTLIDVSCTAGTTRTLNDPDVMDASAALESVTVTVKVSVSADAGVPVTAPPVLMERPSLVAEVKLQVHVSGAVPPVDVNVKL
jgi:hypothetical protein